MRQHSEADYERKLIECGKDIEVVVLYRKDKGIAGPLAECIAHWTNYGCSVRVTEDPFGGFISTTRNTLAYRFLKGSKKFLMMVDDDVIPSNLSGGVDAASILRMAQRDKPVVSGCACGASPQNGLFICVVSKDENGVGRFVSSDHVDAIPVDGISPIYNCGSGFLMVRRDVLETLWNNSAFDRESELKYIVKQLRSGNASAERLTEMADYVEKLTLAYDNTGLPFDIPMSVMAEAVKIGRMPRTEDICFTDRVRDAGFEMFVDWSVHCVHFKQMGLAWPQDQRQDIDAEKWKVPKEAAMATFV